MPWVLEATSSNRLNLYCNTIYTLNTGDGNNNPFQLNGTSINILTDNLWHHFVVTFGSSVAKLYIDGVYRGTAKTFRSPATSSTNTIKLAGGYGNGHSYDWNGMINDFRVYDHCLSAQEVKKIAQGLVLHYPLNNNDKNNYFGWLKANTIKTITRASGNTFVDYEYYTDLISSTETSYIVDFYAKGSASGMILDIYFRNSSGSAYVCTTTQTLTTEYKHYLLSLNGSPSELQIFRARCYGGNAGDIIYLKNVRLLSNNMPCHDTTIIYDSSGYNHNGEIINSISIEENSPKYNNCIHFTATNQKIKIDNLITTGFSNSYSFAWWEKISSVTPMHWGFSNGIRVNGMYTGRLWNTGDGGDNPLYNPGTTTQVTVPTVNVWHHWVMTGDGTKCRVYQDGVLWAEAKTYKAISGTTIYINGWDSSTSYSSSNAFVSDFRIYATALSADDVLELYRTSKIISGTTVTPRSLE